MKEVCNLVGMKHITASGVHYYILPGPFSLSTQVFPPSLPIFAPVQKLVFCSLFASCIREETILDAEHQKKKKSKNSSQI
jgi:hypothetical protein